MSRHETKLLPLLSWRAEICKSDLSPVTRHVALALSLYMSELGDSAHPGAPRLAHDTGRHVSTIRAQLGMLVDRGWLRKVHAGGLQGKRRHSNVYAAAIPRDHVPNVYGDPSSETTRRPETVDPSSSPRPPLVVDDPISSSNSPLNSPEPLSLIEPEPAKPKKKSTRVPDPFTVTEDLVAWADREIPGFNWERESSKFLDYYRSAPDRTGLKKDWPATWRNWMRNNAEGKFSR